MTREELALVLGKDINTLITNFPRTAANLRKKGIIITKWGYGKKAEYEIEYEDIESEEEE